MRRHQRQFTEFRRRGRQRQQRGEGRRDPDTLTSFFTRARRPTARCMACKPCSRRSRAFLLNWAVSARCPGPFDFFLCVFMTDSGFFGVGTRPFAPLRETKKAQHEIAIGQWNQHPKRQTEHIFPHWPKKKKDCNNRGLFMGLVFVRCRWAACVPSCSTSTNHANTTVPCVGTHHVLCKRHLPWLPGALFRILHAHMTAAHCAVCARKSHFNCLLFLIFFIFFFFWLSCGCRAFLNKKRRNCEKTGSRVAGTGDAQSAQNILGPPAGPGPPSRRRGARERALAWFHPAGCRTAQGKTDDAHDRVP